MKKVYFKEIRKNVNKKIVSWISIVIIVFISVMAFLGTAFLSEALNKGGTDFYAESNFRDFEMVSSFGVTEKGISLIKTVTGVKEVEGEILMDARLAFGEEKLPIHLYSLTKNINKVKVVEGRLPEKKGEMIVCVDTMTKNDLKIGDKVSIATSKDGIGTFITIASESFEIVGTCLHPDYMVRGKSDYAVIMPEDFASSVIDETIYTRALITVDTGNVSDIFSQEYFDKTQVTEDNLRKISDTLSTDQDDFIRNIIGDKKAQIKDAVEKAIIEGSKLTGAEEKVVKEFINSVFDGLMDSVFNMVDSMGRSKWVVLNRNLNEGFPDIKHGVTAISVIGTYFTPLFLIIAGLVIYSTVTIIINEQSRQIGAQKALGFRKKEVRKKYIFFGLSASVIGVILGLGGGMLLETVVLGMFTSLYAFGKAKIVFDVFKFLIILVAVIILALAVISLACHRLLKCSPIGLMSGTEPKKKGRTKQAVSRFGTLYSRLILRNMKDEIGRVIVSIAIIMGSTILIGTGFTVFFSFKSFVPKQYKDVDVYSFKINYGDSPTKKVVEEINKILERENAEFITARNEKGFYKAGGKVDVADIVIIDPELMDGYLNILDMKTGKKIDIHDDGMVVQNRIMEKSGLSDGDLISLYNGKLDKQAIKVNDTFKNYVGSLIVMSEEAYKKAYGTEKVTRNTIYVKVAEGEANRIAGEIQDIDESVSVKYPASCSISLWSYFADLRYS